jgi:hypothetical protein
MGLASASGNATNPGALRSTVQLKVVVGLLRDLRGITVATNSRKTYGKLPWKLVRLFVYRDSY